MKVLIQRVTKATVRSEGQVLGRIGPGLLIFLGVEHKDGPQHAKWLAKKCAGLNLFTGPSGQMSRSLIGTGGQALVVSQFTLLANCRKGRTPSFDRAAPPKLACGLYEQFIADLHQCTKTNVESGSFGAMMEVELINDGPVTIWLETPPSFDS